jgi:hypothetical protein
MRRSGLCNNEHSVYGPRLAGSDPHRGHIGLIGPGECLGPDSRQFIVSRRTLAPSARLSSPILGRFDRGVICLRVYLEKLALELKLTEPVLQLLVVHVAKGIKQPPTSHWLVLLDPGQQFGFSATCHSFTSRRFEGVSSSASGLTQNTILKKIHSAMNNQPVNMVSALKASAITSRLNLRIRFVRLRPTDLFAPHCSPSCRTQSVNLHTLPLAD